jgi:hypothetical protein
MPRPGGTTTVNLRRDRERGKGQFNIRGDDAFYILMSLHLASRTVQTELKNQLKVCSVIKHYLLIYVPFGISVRDT